MKQASEQYGRFAKAVALMQNDVHEYEGKFNGAFSEVHRLMNEGKRMHCFRRDAVCW